MLSKVLEDKESLQVTDLQRLVKESVNINDVTNGLFWHTKSVKEFSWIIFIDAFHHYSTLLMF